MTVRLQPGEKKDVTVKVTNAFGRETVLTRHFTEVDEGAHEADFMNPSGFETGSSLPTSVVDPEERTRTYVFDDFDRLVSSTSEEHGTQR